MNRRPTPAALLGAALAVAALTLSGCHQKPRNSARQRSPGARTVGAGAIAAARQAGQTVSDSAITTKVRTTLATSQGLSGYDLHVKTHDGVVTLTGTVDQAAQKALAGDTARNTDGVASVRNKIVVKGRY